ncbi:MAG: radical SAM protein [Chlorobi bacterium]|nr:radical SAM protein [Chlorobiota bacterium]
MNTISGRCNLRCVYCMPAEGIKLLKHSDILSFDEIIEVAEFGAKNGINKIRITGGEPLVRKNIVELVRMISKIDEIEEVAMTTNGVYLNEYANDLADAGLKRVNISLDTIDPLKYAKITRGGDINRVFKGIAAAKKAGLEPIKINCVVDNNSQEKDAVDIRAFCKENNLNARFIRKMDLTNGKFWKVEGGEGGDCNICNRLRLTSDGMIKPCLFDDQEYNVRELGVEKAFKMAISLKPKCGTLNHINKFHNIGG